MPSLNFFVHGHDSFVPVLIDQLQVVIHEPCVCFVVSAANLEVLEDAECYLPYCPHPFFLLRLLRLGKLKFAYEICGITRRKLHLEGIT